MSHEDQSLTRPERDFLTSGILLMGFVVMWLWVSVLGFDGTTLIGGMTAMFLWRGVVMWRAWSREFRG